jgi:hypothetical protein
MPRVKSNDQREELNALAGLYALDDSETTVIGQTMEAIEFHRNEAERLGVALFTAVAKFAGVPRGEEAKHFGFGAIDKYFVVFDARLWTIDPERGLLPIADADEVAGSVTEEPDPFFNTELGEIRAELFGDAPDLDPDTK